MTERAAIAAHPALQWRDTGAVTIDRPLAEETPVAIAYDGRSHAVLMATPADAADLGVGFTLTERIAAYAEIGAVTVSELDEGLRVDIALAPAAQDRLADARQRMMEARSSCGLCGVSNLEEAVRPLPRLTGGPRLTYAALHAALAALDDAQSLGRQTRATHAAAWADEAGALRLVREDVGRHNALDKLIGAAAKAALDPALAFIIVTSRCSYEMVEKASLAGITVLVAISAPTALAVRKAEEAGMTLVALARADGHTVFTGAERLADAFAQAAE